MTKKKQTKKKQTKTAVTKRRILKTAEVVEKEACKFLNLPHKGGPGNPDCTDGAVVADVKNRARPVDASTIRQVAATKWAQDKPLIVASTPKGGVNPFTPGAVKAAEELGVTLVGLQKEARKSTKKKR